MRRDLLEASKSMVHVLKGQNNLRSARAAKQKMTEALRAKLSEISILVAEARTMLPAMNKAMLPHDEPKPRKQPAAPPRSRPRQTHRMPEEHHIDRFEKDLQDIEKKLKAL